jgi:hypothetical protein
MSSVLNEKLGLLNRPQRDEDWLYLARHGSAQPSTIGHRIRPTKLFLQQQSDLLSIRSGAGYYTTHNNVFVASIAILEITINSRYHGFLERRRQWRRTPGRDIGEVQML